MSDFPKHEIDFDQARIIITDDTSPKGQTFLERNGEEKWRIVLPGECFIISDKTLRKLAQEHIIAAHPNRKEIFLPTAP